MDKKILAILGISVTSGLIIMAGLKAITKHNLSLGHRFETHVETNNQMADLKFKPFGSPFRAKVTPPKVVSTQPVAAIPVAKEEAKIETPEARKARLRAERKAARETEKLAQEKERRNKRKKRLAAQARKKAQKKPTLQVEILKDKDTKTVEKDEGSQSLVMTAPPKSPAQEAFEKRELALKDLEVQLLTSGKIEDLNKLMRLYQAGKLTSAEYFGILKKMQASANSSIRRLAVVGAAIQMGFESFQILAALSFDSDSTVHSQAQQASDAYKAESQIEILASAMSAGDLYSKIRSIQLLEVLIQNSTIASSTNPTEPTDPNQTGRSGRPPTSGGGTSHSSLARFVPILENLSTTGETINLRSLALSTLESLRRVIG